MAKKSLALKALKHQSLNPSLETSASLSGPVMPTAQVQQLGGQRLLLIAKCHGEEDAMNEGFYFTCFKKSQVFLC